MVAQKLRHVDIVLDAVGHHHAHNAILAQRFHAQGRGNGAVLAARNAEHRVAAGAVFFKELADPGHTVPGHLFYVKHRGFLLLHVDLARAHGRKRRLVQRRGHACAAGGVYGDIGLGEAGL